LHSWFDSVAVYWRSVGWS